MICRKVRVPVEAAALRERGLVILTNWQATCAELQGDWGKNPDTAKGVVPNSVAGASIVRIAALGASALLPTLAAQAKETAKDKYTFDTACLAISEAAAALPDAYAKQKSAATTMRQLYAKRLTASAPAVGVTPAKALADVEDVRRSAAAGVRPSAPNARSEQADLAKNLERCEALPVFEIIDARKK